MFTFLGRFPEVTYNGYNVNNILVKIAINNLTKKYTTVFYPYVIKEGERPDIIAADYYGDARYDWLVYLCNNITDPYYQWPLSTNEFNSFINKKYGSFENANRQIAFWRNNWYKDDSIITSSYYDALPAYAKKYWAPSDSGSTTATSYVRKNVDFSVETNKILSLAVSNNTPIVAGDNIYQYSAGTLSGSGRVMDSSKNTLTVKDVIGTFIANTVYTLSNTANTTATSSNTLYTSIDSNEAVYWEYVTSYEYEEELNESRKHILILDKAFLGVIESQLDQLL
jgi:hypothetical protein